MGRKITAPDGNTIRTPVCGAGVAFAPAGGGCSAKADEAKRPAATAIAAIIEIFLKPRTGSSPKLNDHHRMPDCNPVRCEANQLAVTRMPRASAASIAKIHILKRLVADFTVLDQGHGGLQVVALFAGDAQLIALDSDLDL